MGYFGQGVPEPNYDDDLERFREEVEENTGQEIHPDPFMGDNICWFFLDIPLELNGETFEAEVDFDLSEEEVKPLSAEIYVESGTEREEKLSEVANQIEDDGDRVLYEYYIDEGEVEEVMADLREAHANVYG